jgi:pectinesterase
MAQGITIRNTAGPAGMQAVALRSRSHFSLVYRCSIEGFQDTLDADTGLQMYLESSIHGTIDFIFGYARAAFLGCRLLVRHPGPYSHQNFVTAQGRSNPNDSSGFVFQNCSLTADEGVNLTGVETFLGRPWKEHSHVMFMESFIDSIVHEQGWVEWERGKKEIPETVLYLEYGNTGPGADTAKRVKMGAAVRVANCSEAEGYTADRFINASQWMPAEPKGKVTIPYPRGLQNPCRGGRP